MPGPLFAAYDVSQVADLYWWVLRERKGPVPSTVQSFLLELYKSFVGILSSRAVQNQREVMHRDNKASRVRDEEPANTGTTPSGGVLIGD